MKEVLIKLVDKLNNPDDVFIYLIILGLFGLVMYQSKTIRRISDASQKTAVEIGRQTELLRLLVGAKIRSRQSAEGGKLADANNEESG